MSDPNFPQLRDGMLGLGGSIDAWGAHHLSVNDVSDIEVSQDGQRPGVTYPAAGGDKKASDQKRMSPTTYTPLLKPPHLLPKEPRAVSSLLSITIVCLLLR